MASQSETVRVIRVFVSSPNDVRQEREALDEVVARINRNEGRERGIRLELWKWEDDAVPHVGPKAQAAIDQQTPAYDVYLGIMAHRFGTKTGHYGSGTEKEFRDALKRWSDEGSPWILFYFSDAPVRPSEMDVTQLQKVDAFRKAVARKGLYATYDGLRGSEQAFVEKVSEHLQKIVVQLARLQTKGGRSVRKPARATESRRAGSRRKAARPPSIPQDYLRWLQDDCADIGLLGLRVQQGQTVRLNNVYVPLTTQAESKADLKRGGQFSAGGEDRPVQLLLDLLGNDSLYVSGPPGSGKSTFCRRVAWLACEGKMPDTQVAEPEKYIEQFPPAFAGRLPLLVRLREFWPHIAHTPSCREMTPAELEAELVRWVDGKKPGGLPGAEVQLHLENGSLLLILDGFDEVPLSHGDDDHPCQLRAMLLAGLMAALKAWTVRGNRVLLTSRPYGISEGDARRLPLRAAPLGDLDGPMRELLVRRWFHCLLTPADAAEKVAREMLQHITQRQDLQPLMANPMLLTAMCIIYHQGQRLPQHRHDLYDRIVDNVLFNRFPEDRTVIDPVRNRLAVVAYGMHTGEGLGEERTTPQPEATYAEVDRMIQTYQDQTPWTEPGYTNAVEAREQLLTRTGLLLPRGENHAGFYHFTFQDFLAAQRLLDVCEEGLFEVFWERGETPEWRGTLSFVLGSQLAKHSSPQRSIVLLGRLIDALSDDHVGLALVVGECLQILTKHGLRLKESLEERFRQYCLAAIQRRVPVQARFELGLALGHLTDPRIVVDLRDPNAYVEIAAGTYPVGDDQLHQKYDWVPKESKHRLAAPLRLSRYPVTNVQYAVFIEEGGYKDRRGWSAAGWQWRQAGKIVEPEFWSDAKWNAPNKPVVGVSYWEAEAFAAWAGGRLPTALEWESAARGPNGCMYPWGEEWVDGICNSAEAGLGETSPVGIFPESRSKDFGLEDMAGNVWEWCADDETPSREATHRVDRGGSWADDAGYCRSACRVAFEPAYRLEFLGFRVAAVPLTSSRNQQPGQAEPGAQAEG